MTPIAMISRVPDHHAPAEEADFVLEFRDLHQLIFNEIRES